VRDRKPTRLDLEQSAFGDAHQEVLLGRRRRDCGWPLRRCPSGSDRVAGNRPIFDPFTTGNEGRTGKHHCGRDQPGANPPPFKVHQGVHVSKLASGMPLANPRLRAMRPR